MRAANLGSSSAIAASRSCRTPILRGSGKSSSTFIPCGSRRANCGVSRQTHAILCTLICGKAILHQHDSVLNIENIMALPRLRRDEGGPVFAEPWQAQAFALAVRLSEQGHFTWREWAATLASELGAAAKRGEPDDGNHYYEHWLRTLERLVTDKGLADSAALLARKNAWADAY